MKKIAFVTDVPFWNKSAGNEQRVLQILSFLKEHAEISLFVVGRISSKKKEWVGSFGFVDVYEISFWKQRILRFVKNFINSFFPYLRTYLKKVRTPGSLSSRSSKKVNAFVEKKIGEIGCDVLWVEYVWLSYLFDNIPKSVTKIIDTHDVQYDRCKSFAAQGLTYDFQIDEKDEINALSKADAVLAINHRDYDILKEKLNTKVIEYPYAPRFDVLNEEISNDSSLRIAFVGSAIDFNIMSLKWFVDNVWPLVLKNVENVEFHVYGKVSNFIRPQENVFTHGFVKNESEIYQKNMVLVNPIFMGGGLKIKCAEALAYGMPLLTTSVGAQGLENGINSAFYVADDADDFASKLCFLLTNSNQRRILKNNAKEFWLTFCETVSVAEQSVLELLK